MKVFLVVLAIFVVAAWANEEEEQDEIEVMEVEDPGYWKPKPPKYCGTKKVCMTKQRCYDDLKIITKCSRRCYVAKTKCYKKYMPYSYAPKTVCKPIKKCKHICVKVPTTTVLKKICKPYKSCKYVPKKCYHKPYVPKHYMHQPYYPPKSYYHKPTYKPCFKTVCVTKEVCKLDFFTRQQKVCTPKKYKCGYSYDYYGPKYCYKKVCKTIGIKTPKKVCKPVKKCSKVPKKCPKKYY